MRVLHDLLAPAVPALALACAVVAHAVPARAEGPAARTATAAEARRLDELKVQLREELREELKAELKAELSADLAGAAAPAVQADTFAEEEWKWEEPVKPELDFLQLDGFFRFRYDLFSNLDLGLLYVNTELGQTTGPFAPGFAPPSPLCNLDQGARAGAGAPAERSCANGAGSSDTLGGGNIRLRLEPTFNVHEDIRVKMQVDVLDNLVLGSTPSGFPPNPISPLIAFSQAQVAPVDGINATWTDSVRVKRVWAEIGTPIGQLRVGRMPNHFGMGILANEGRGLDTDFGDSVDRIMFATKLGDFYVIPGYDWVASGPTSANRLEPFGQAFDRDQRDDVDQYSLAIVRRDSDDVVRQRLENDELVLNYGTFQAGRFQALDAAGYYNSGDPDDQPGDLRLLERDAQLYVYSFWMKLLWRRLTIEAEYAGVIGKAGNIALDNAYGARDLTQPDGLDVNQHGGAVNVEYRLLRDESLTLRLLVVAASGDSAPGWGIYPLLGTAGTRGQWDGSQAPAGDRRVTNFRFDPDFQVDLIFWRQLVGMVTDALVVRPGLQYDLAEGIGARLDVVFSRALFSASTPSGSFDGALGDPGNNLGLEGDVTLFLKTPEGFSAWLQYGVLFPLSGLDRQLQVEASQPRGAEIVETVVADEQVYGRLEASVAHTLQLLLAVSF